MYPSTFAHLDRHYELPTNDIAAPRRPSGSRRGLLRRMPALALRLVPQHSAGAECR